MITALSHKFLTFLIRIKLLPFTKKNHKLSEFLLLYTFAGYIKIINKEYTHKLCNNIFEWVISLKSSPIAKAIHKKLFNLPLNTQRNFLHSSHPLDLLSNNILRYLKILQWIRGTFKFPLMPGTCYRDQIILICIKKWVGSSKSLCLKGLSKSLLQLLYLSCYAPSLIWYLSLQQFPSLQSARFHLL